MYFANTSDGKRIHIGDAKPHQQYYCPACGESMVQKRGNINAHHFAHKSKNAVIRGILENYLRGMRKCRASLGQIFEKG